MNTINMPGFSAEASFYNGKAHYTRSYRQEAHEEQRGELQRTVVIPQLPQKNAPGPGACLVDCIDQHPDWTAARCGAGCRVGGSGGPDSPPRDATDCALSFGGIQFWYAACIANPLLFGVSFVSDLFGGPTCASIRDDKIRETISSGCR